MAIDGPSVDVAGAAPEGKTGQWFSDGKVMCFGLNGAAGGVLATAIEVIEMVAIVVGVGVARSWRASLVGASAGLVVLAVMVAGLGTAVREVPLTPVRLVVGALLLVFGLQWLRKGVLRVARDGWGVGHSAADVDSADSGERRFDWTGFVLSFKGVTLEGLEVAVIVATIASLLAALFAYRLIPDRAPEPGVLATPTPDAARAGSPEPAGARNPET